jgi:transcriptional regulator with XRE-family HTH domain
MDDRQAGSLLRLIRIQRRRRQKDVAEKARVPRSVVIKIEAGRLEQVTVGQLRAVVQANGAWLENRIHTPGDDGLRMLRRAHAEAQQQVIERLASDNWITVPEASFSIYGERGVIDVLAWQPLHRALLIVETKTLLVDLGDLLATMDRRIRLSGTIAAERGWAPQVVGAWIAVTDTRLNRQRLSTYAELLRSAFPADGRQIGAWLREPRTAIRALGFLHRVAVGDLRHVSATPRRVRAGRTSRPPHDSGRDNPEIVASGGREPRVGVAFHE